MLYCLRFYQRSCQQVAFAFEVQEIAVASSVIRFCLSFSRAPGFFDGFTRLSDSLDKLCNIFRMWGSLAECVLRVLVRMPQEMTSEYFISQ